MSRFTRSDSVESPAAISKTKLTECGRYLINSEKTIATMEAVRSIGLLMAANLKSNFQVAHVSGRLEICPGCKKHWVFYEWEKRRGILSVECVSGPGCVYYRLAVDYAPEAPKNDSAPPPLSTYQEPPKTPPTGFSGGGADAKKAQRGLFG